MLQAIHLLHNTWCNLFSSTFPNRNTKYLINLLKLLTVKVSLSRNLPKISTVILRNNGTSTSPLFQLTIVRSPPVPPPPRADNGQPEGHAGTSLHPQTVRRVLIPAGLVVSCVFLAATLLCHLCVAPLRDRHGLCLAAYVASLLAADATLFFAQAFSSYLSPTACVFVGE